MDRKLLLYLSYDGRDFCGFQAQPDKPNVQMELNRAAEELFGFPCDVTGCSRTDSGVHAHMFCATIAKKGEPGLVTHVSPQRVPRAMCVRLPDSISVYDAMWVPADFHPRYDVTSKEYIYRILVSQQRDPFEIGRAWHFPFPLAPDGIGRMGRAAAHFVGTRDFSACMAVGSKIKDPTRHVMESEVTRVGDIVTFRVRADGFLYNMVRIMAGTLAMVGTGKVDPDSIPARLASLDRSQMGRTAPPEGLYLNRVFYDDSGLPGWHGGDAYGS